MVTATKSLFNALGEEEDLLQILSRATHALKRLNLRKLYMALTLARYRADMLHVVAAGMPPVLVYRHATGRVERVVLKGMPLGSFPDFPYREAALPLGPRDTVLFMSDGFTELFNEAREELGFERAAAVFADVAREDPDTIIAALNAHAHTWTGGGAPHDDMTFVVLKRRAEVKTRGVRPPALAPPPVVPADVAP